MMPAGPPGRERRELPDQRQRSEEEIAGAKGDDEQGDDQRHGALPPGAQRRRPDPPAETVPAGAPAQVVELVEVRVLAESRAHAPGEDRHLGDPLVLGLGTFPRRGGDRVGRLEALMRQAAEVAREPRAPPHLQAAHLGVGKEAMLGEPTAQDGQLGQPAEVPTPGAGDGPGPVAVTGQDGDEELAEGEQRRLGQHPEQCEPRVALEDDPQLVPPLQRLQGDRVASDGFAHGRQQRLEPAGDRLAVAYPGVGGDHDPRAGDLAAPREVEVLAHGDDPGVEPVQLGEEVGPDQNAPARGDEDIAHGVVLPVVDLALEDAVHHGARLVATHADVEQDAGVVPVHELRGHHAGVGAERLLHQLVDGIGIERHVVVQEEEEGGALHHAERLVGRSGVAGVTGQVPDEGVGEHPAHPCRDLGIVLPGREDEDRHLLVVLGLQGQKGLFEPGSGSARHDDGDHGRHLGFHQGAEAIRSAILSFRHEMHPQVLATV